jgi:quercetin dioxygenase-like cupin family protein
MKSFDIRDFKDGWFIGNFLPSIHQTKEFEVSFKHFKKEDREPKHFQKIASEITLVISGKIRLGDNFFEKGKIILIFPDEEAEFECIEECEVICIKFPSIPGDKIIS